VSGPLRVEFSDLAKTQVRAAEQWWRQNRPKAPNAIREELERAAVLIALQPDSGAHARNVSLPGVRRIHLARIRYYLFYRVVLEQERIDILALWHSSRHGAPPL
jgi:plasmid stabilization system protein ParE